MGVARRAVLLAVVLACCLWLVGCYVAPGYVGFAPPGVVVGPTVMAPGPPPAPPGEAITVAPGPGFVWIGGYWDWGPSGWLWVHGRWGHGPWHGAVWVGPRWEHHGHGWVMRHGHWR